MLPRISLVEGDKAKFLLFSSGDYISQHLFTYGSWDEPLLAISKIFYDAVESPLILDIGANLGAYSIPIAKDIQNSDGKIIAFEPQRIIFYQLCANAFINRLDNYYPINKAVGDQVGTLEIPEFNYAINNNVGAFSLQKDFRVAHGIESSVTDKKHVVDVITLDELQVDRAPALIKIDVEGYEINVLKGSTFFLKKHNFPPIFFEAWEFDWFEEGKRQLLSFVESVGYNLFQFDGMNFLAQHPDNSVAIDFKFDNGVLKWERIR